MGQLLSDTTTHYRDYDPGVGRYIESDPIGLWAGLQTFGYVSGNPLRWSDALGLDTCGKKEPDTYCFYRCITPPGFSMSYCERRECTSGSMECRVTRKDVFVSFDHDYTFVGDIPCAVFEYREEMERRRRGLPPRPEPVAAAGR